MIPLTSVLQLLLILVQRSLLGGCRIRCRAVASEKDTTINPPRLRRPLRNLHLRDPTRPAHRQSRHFQRSM